MNEYLHHARFEDALAVKVRYAVLGQEPASLAAVSVGVDRAGRCLRVRGHFDAPPSEEDEEMVGVIATEIISQWVLPGWDIAEDWEAVAPGGGPEALPGGVAWRRGDPPPGPAGA